MDFEFTVFERRILLNILPTIQTDVMVVKALRDLQDDLGFSNEELKALEFRQEGPQIFWKADADVPKTVDISDPVRKAIARQFRLLSERGLLTLEHLPLYERFVEETVEAAKER